MCGWKGAWACPEGLLRFGLHDARAVTPGVGGDGREPANAAMARMGQWSGLNWTGLDFLGTGTPYKGSRSHCGVSSVRARAAWNSGMEAAVKALRRCFAMSWL